MASIILFFLMIFIILTVGGLGFYLIFIKSRPKTRNWIAKCYQMGDGVKPKIRDNKGKILLDIKLNDLIPLKKDRLIKTETKDGISYMLSQQKITTNAVTADMVEDWGDDKEVHVLIMNDQASVLKKGIHKESTKVIFNPMERERVDLIVSDITHKKDRMRQEKNIWQQITTWIVAGILMLGMVSGIFLTVDGQVKTTEKLEAMTKDLSKKQVEISQNFLKATEIMAGYKENQETVQLGKVTPPDTKGNG